jgi:poly-beta-1,6-N-acetyl-D-glucosamine synthase
MAGIFFWICVLLIFYVYAGYPFLVFLFSAVFGRKQEYSLSEPPVTMLIAAYNEEKVIGAKLQNCLELDYPRDKLQIIVAVDGLEDKTADVVRAFADQGVELSFSPDRNGKVAAINRAIQQARHEIVVFSDANNHYPKDAIRELVKPFSDPSVGAVSGSKVVGVHEDSLHLGQAEGLYWKYESLIKKRESMLGCCIGVAGEQLAIRKDLFIAAPVKIINDDFYIALQIIKQGFNVVYAPAAKSYEAVSASQQDELIRRSRIVAGRYQVMGLSLPLLPFRRPVVVWQIVSHKYMRPLVPFLMIFALLSNVLAVFSAATTQVNTHPWLTLQPPAGTIILALQVVFYLLAVFGANLKSKGFLGKMLYLPTFLIASNYAALLGLVRYLAGKQTAVWKKVAR